MTPSIRNHSCQVKAGRSDLWAAIYLALAAGDEKDGAPAGAGPTDHSDDLDDMLWNLRTWPLELIEWPMSNNHRLDLVFVGEPDRFGHRNSISRVLPANERGQSRWNANPFDVSDTGTGTTEMDPGAYLLPYWLARYHGLIAAPTHHSY